MSRVVERAWRDPAWARAAIASLAWLESCSILAQPPAPLDLVDGTPREVLVRVEDSGDLATVGQSFGPEYPATYSAFGTVGTLVISAETHELMLAGGFPAVPGSFTPIVIEFDLTTFEAASQAASGATGNGQIGSSFTQNALDTLGLAGFMGPDVPALFCTSQAQVDQACMFAPSFCGQVCTIVPGQPYDPVTGLVNLVGIETQSGCDGAFCSGPVNFFARRGDLLLTEAPPADAGGGGNNDPCFIATAAYGTPLADELGGLRAFRDSRLLQNAAGAAFSDAYYRLSPSLADRIAGDTRLRRVVRCALAPLVHFVNRE